MKKIVFLVAMMVSCNSFALRLQPDSVSNEALRICNEIDDLANKKLDSGNLPEREVMDAIYFCQGIVSADMPNVLKLLNEKADKAKKASSRDK